MEKFTFFYKTANPFSQWHKSKFIVDGMEFNCAEQYMMYKKAMLFNDTQRAELIMKKKDPREQKALGREVNIDIDVWNRERFDIVYQGNYAKFTQNENLKKYLLDTAGTTLVEASPTDTVWGIGMSEEDPDRLDRSKWKGTNLLGEVLTKLREDLLKEEKMSRAE
jgi:ribA/ribD-fused uncharacterized protein